MHGTTLSSATQLVCDLYLKTQFTSLNTTVRVGAMKLNKSSIANIILIDGQASSAHKLDQVSVPPSARSGILFLIGQANTEPTAVPTSASGSSSSARVNVQCTVPWTIYSAERVALLVLTRAKWSEESGQHRTDARRRRSLGPNDTELFAHRLAAGLC